MFSTIVDTWHGPKWDVRSLVKAQDGKRVSSATPVKDDGQPKDPYAGEIDRLEEALGHPLEKGACIEFKLQDLLRIIPRKRRRIDAYRGLVSRLKNMEVTLTIKSNKTKHHQCHAE